MKMKHLPLLAVASILSLAAPVAQAQDNVPARDIATSSIDVKLINQCIESGKSKANCLCVTKINKYELSLAEYKLAAKLFGRDVQGAPPVHNSATVLKVAHKQRSLIGASNFNARCEAASSYFSQSQG